MKKATFFSLYISFFFAVNSSTAQQETAGLITYIQRHGNSVMGGDDYYLGELRFRGQEVSYTYKTLPSIMEAKDTVDAQGNSIRFYGKSAVGGRPTGNIVYINYAIPQVECAQYIERENFTYSDSLPNIPWVIGEEKKIVGGFMCQKASGMYRGRMYDVWFAPEMPVPYGPWKLGGLPGLILEAETQDGELSFTVDEIQIPAKDSFEIAPPRRGIHFLDFQTFWEESNRYEEQSMERRRLSHEKALREKLPEGTPISVGKLRNSRFSIEKWMN